MWKLGAPLGLIIAILPWLWWYVARNATPHRALLHPRVKLISTLLENRSTPKPWISLVGVTLIALAITDPRWYDPQAVREHNGRDIVLALDMSASMRAEDFLLGGKTVRRFDAVRATASTLISARAGDRVGIVVFGDDAYTLIPLTHDVELADELLQNVEIGMAGDKTALGDALALAVNLSAKSNEREHVIVLFTDGASTSGALHPDVALDMATKANVRVHTVAIGGTRRAAFSRGKTDGPQFVDVPLDVERLQRIATQSGGKYFHGEDNNALAHIGNELDKLETHSGPLVPPSRGIALFWVPLALGLGLLGIHHWRNILRVTPA